MDISFQIKAQLSLKNAWLPPIFFLIALVKMRFFHIVMRGTCAQ